MSPLHIAFAILVPLLWGINFVAAKFGVSYYPPFLLTALRFTAASIILLPLVKRPPAAALKRIALISSLSALHFSLIFVALAFELDIASSAIIGQLGVPVACLIGVWLYGDKLGWWRIGGIAIAFSGTAIVAGTPQIFAHMHGFYAALGSTITWGIANALVKRVEGVSSMSLLAWMGACTVPILYALSYVFEYNQWPDIFHPTLPALLGVSYTVLCSTILAYGLWYFLLTRYTVSQVAPYSLLTPIFGIAFGQIFFSETLTPATIIGGILTIVGVAVITIRRPKTMPLSEAV